MKIESEPMIVPSVEQIRLGALRQYVAQDNGEADGYRDDLQFLLTLLDTLSREVERLRNENQELLTRSGKPDDQRDFSIHASTDGAESQR